VDWQNLLFQSLEFLSVEHAFRYNTEADTRHPHQAFVPGYISSLNSLHGWGDGDPFLVNYVGHPMQGAVSAFLFVDNDRQYRTAVFGRNRRYWKSRLRAAAFAWAYSEQFEIGPISEATVGNVPSIYPAHGFVDHVITPTIGLGWMIAEDSIDRYIIDPIDARVGNPFVRAIVRGGLNPSRSFSNFMAWHLPWYRASRTGDVQVREMVHAPQPREPAADPPPGVAPFEVLVNATAQQFLGQAGRGSCIGSGGTAAFRASQHWQYVGSLSGCKLTDIGLDYTGDSLVYMVGPRWSPAAGGRWSPYVQLLAGGRTFTHEKIDPVAKARLQAALPKGVSLPNEDHSLYARDSESTGFAFSVGGGVDLKMTSALAWRAAHLGYTWTGNATLDQVSYSHALEFSTGLVIRMGTW
jgi:hypothetical protein